MSFSHKEKTIFFNFLLDLIKNDKVFNKSSSVLSAVIEKVPLVEFSNPGFEDLIQYSIDNKNINAFHWLLNNGYRSCYPLKGTIERAFLMNLDVNFVSSLHDKGLLTLNNKDKVYEVVGVNPNLNNKRVVEVVDFLIDKKYIDAHDFLLYLFESSGANSNNPAFKNFYKKFAKKIDLNFVKNAGVEKDYPIFYSFINHSAYKQIFSFLDENNIDYFMEKKSGFVHYLLSSFPGIVDIFLNAVDAQKNDGIVSALIKNLQGDNPYLYSLPLFSQLSWLKNKGFSFHIKNGDGYSAIELLLSKFEAKNFKNEPDKAELECFLLDIKLQSAKEKSKVLKI